MNVPVTKFVTVYGDTVHVATADWDDAGLKLLRIYTRDGRRWGDTQAGLDAAKRHQPIMVHRDNLCPPNIAALGAVAKAAERLLARMDFIAAYDLKRGGETQEERDTLREALRALHT
jgi:hypothetical protein